MPYYLFKNMSLYYGSLLTTKSQRIKYFSCDNVLIYYEKKMANPGDIDNKLPPSP